MVQFFIASDDCFREKFCWYILFSVPDRCWFGTQNLVGSFKKRVTFTGPKQTRRKKQRPWHPWFFLVGGDKKGNLDPEIAHKNDIWLMSESRLPSRVWKNPQEISSQNAMIWKHSIHPALWTKAPFGCLNFFTAGRQSHVGYQHYCRPDGYRCCWCMCCSGRASCRGGEEWHGPFSWAKPFKFNVFLQKKTPQRFKKTISEVRSWPTFRHKIKTSQRAGRKGRARS